MDTFSYPNGGKQTTYVQRQKCWLVTHYIGINRSVSYGPLIYHWNCSMKYTPQPTILGHPDHLRSRCWEKLTMMSTYVLVYAIIGGLRHRYVPKWPGKPEYDGIQDTHYLLVANAAYIEISLIGEHNWYLGLVLLLTKCTVFISIPFVLSLVMVRTSNALILSHIGVQELYNETCVWTYFSRFLVHWWRRMISPKRVAALIYMTLSEISV